MNGKLGVPYRFFYSSKNFVSGLTNIMAKVKRPDDLTLGVYNLVETGDADFTGTYYFDIIATQLMPEGEYTVIIKELSSGNRQISKVTLQNATSDLSLSLPAEIFAKLSLNDQIETKIIEAKPLVAKIMASEITAEIKKESRIKAMVINPIINGRISSEIIVGVLKEAC